MFVIDMFYLLYYTDQYSLLDLHSTISELSHTNVVTRSRESISEVNEDVVSNQISWNGLT